MNKIIITSEQVIDWFSKNNKIARQYQINCVSNKIPAHFNKGNKIVVLAAAPSAGKTQMSICFVEKYLQQFPSDKVLILTHGQTTLRSQYYQELVEIKDNLSFTFHQIQTGKDIDNIKNNQVSVAIPQTLTGKKLPKFNLVVIDEAHHFYETKDDEGMIKNILKTVKPTHQLLLTGSPSRFIRKGYEIIPVSVKTLYDEKMVSDLVIDNVVSKYSFTNKDYNANNELKDVKFKKGETNSTLDIVLDSLYQRIRSINKNNPKLYSLTGLKPVKTIDAGIAYVKSIFTDISKTMIACKSIEQANQVFAYFTSKGINTVISHSKSDKDSLEMQRFKTDINIKILIVVDRGILGLNVPELETVIDMTGSKNPDTIFQLMCRVLRQHPTSKQKLFIKVAPHDMSDYFKAVMNFTMYLCFDQFYTIYNGKNAGEIKLKIKRSITKHIEKNTRVKGKRKRTTEFEFFLPMDLPAIEFFTDLLYSKKKEFSSYAFTTLKEVNEKYHEVEHWTKEKVIALLEGRLV